MVMQLKNRIEEILKNYRPVMNGEIYLSGEDVCELLHISKGPYSNIAMTISFTIYR
jgi:hypothetical protein